MAETNNLKLALPTSNEYVDVEVLNENFRKIDTSVLLALAAAVPYSAAATYAQGAYCTKDGKLYRCTVAILQAEAWNAAHWTATTVGAELVAIYTTLANKDATPHAAQHAKGGSDPITPESIGAAPGGFGLGLVSAPLVDGDDVNEHHGNGSYAWGSIKPKNAPTLLRSNGDYQYMLEFGTDEGFTQIVGCYIEKTPGLICRQAFAKSGGVQFAEWEWINPPMKLGVEYRTVERFQGKPVYVKTINMGNLPGNAVKQANFQSNNVVDKIVSVTGQCTSDSGVGISMPYHTGAGPNLETVIYIGAATIGKTQIVTFLRDYSGYKDASITVKYTKLAD